MWLIPYRSFSLETRLAPKEVTARLAAVVEPFRWFRLWRFGSRCPFQGEVSTSGFRIMRIIGYNNSWLSVIYGRIVPTGNGTRVEGAMTPHPALCVFTVLWLGLAGLFGLVAVCATVALGDWNPAALIPFGMFLFGWSVMTDGFTFEVWLSLRKLREIVAAE